MSPTAPRSPSPRSRTQDVDTRDAIVRAALTLFAKHGVDGVSLRQIVGAAGQANPSAVHYHFQSKEGLVGAVLRHVQDQLLPMQEQALATMDEAAAQGELTARDVMRLWVTPAVLIYAGSVEGRMAIRFLSRLTWQPQHMGQDQLVGCSQVQMVRVCDHLERLIPNRSRERLFFLTVLATANMLHALSDASVLSKQTVLGLDRLFEEKPFELVDWIVDYLADGLTGQLASAGTQAPRQGTTPQAA